jgi:SAM-dependent methyltransferase
VTQAQPIEKTTPKIEEGVFCPACKKEKSQIVWLGVSGDPEWPVYFCRHCRLRFIKPKFDDLKAYYRGEYRKTHSDSRGHTSKNGETPEETAHDRFVMQQFAATGSANAFKAVIPAGASVLEVGASAGGFLSHIQDDYDVFATEWNSDDVAFLKKHEMQVDDRDLPDVFPGKKFTAVVARQVLEHQTDPVGFLEQCKDKLIGGGWLFLEIPNVNNALVSVYALPEYLNWYYQTPHITYWEPEVVGSLLNALGFEAKIEPIQRFGLLQAAAWITRRHDSAEVATIPPKVVSPKHPLAGVLNRLWAELDRKYRIGMTTFGTTDQMRIIGRRREI